MKDFFYSKKFKVILCIVALFFGFMLQSAASGNTQSVAGKILGSIAAPFQSAATSIKNGVQHIGDYFANVQDLQSEIDDLKSQNRQLKQQLVDLEQYKEENEAYRQMLNIAEDNPDYQMVTATVIGRDPADRFYSFTINKGSSSGIEEDDTVITEDGLVGIVVDVAPGYASVMTILDPALSIGCYSLNSHDTGVLTGDISMLKSGETKLKYLSLESTLSEGEFVLTTGIGGLCPRDVIVGTVKEVKNESSGVSKYAVIDPAVDVSTVSSVIVITDYQE